MTGILLFTNMFLVIFAYGIVRPVRNAIVASTIGSASLPAIWIWTPISMFAFVMIYNALVDRFDRNKVTLGALSFFTVFLLACRMFVGHTSGLASFVLVGAIYVWADVFSVVMTEIYWTYANAVFDEAGAKKNYGWINAGSIAGGLFGSWLAALAVRAVGTYDLIYVSVFFCVVNLATTIWMFKIPRPPRNRDVSEVKLEGEIVRTSILKDLWFVIKNRYLFLILASVLLSQTVSNLIDYEFNILMEKTVSGMDGRTEFYAKFLVGLSIASLIFSYGMKPLLRLVGLSAIYQTTPAANLAILLSWLAFPVPVLGFALKFFDKALNYSFDRVCKEIFFIHVPDGARVKAKSVIDMFGYRASMAVGAGMVWLLLRLPLAQPVRVGTIGVILLLFVVRVTLLRESAANRSRTS